VLNKIHSNIPGVLYSNGTSEASDILPAESISVLTIQKVGSMGLFNSIVKSGISCGKFHRISDYLKMNTHNTHFVIDCVRDPLAIAISLCFQHLVIKKQIVGQDHFDSIENVMVDFEKNKYKLFDRIQLHLFNRFIDNNRINRMFIKHSLDLMGNLGISMKNINSDIGKSISLSSITSSGQYINYFLFKCEYLDQSEFSLIEKMPSFFSKFEYEVGHKTEDKSIGSIYKEFKEFISFKEDYLVRYYSNSIISNYYNSTEIERFVEKWLT